jgi:hypothetical protein
MHSLWAKTNYQRKCTTAYEGRFCAAITQVGSSQGETLRDMISEAFMQAARAGILCVASAGNAGEVGTVTNSMPWALTGAQIQLTQV